MAKREINANPKTGPYSRAVGKTAVTQSPPIPKSNGSTISEPRHIKPRKTARQEKRPGRLFVPQPHH